MCIHLYDLLDVLDLVHELHLCHPPDLLELPDRSDHTHCSKRNRNTAGAETIKVGARCARAPPFVVAMNVGVSVVSVSVVCAQGDQVVPAYQVDDID